eukprot:398234_1
MGVVHSSKYKTSESHLKRVPTAEHEKLLSRFGETERQMLFNLFEDLAHRSMITSKHGHHHEDAIDKATFLRVFKLPGMLGERLFAAFNQSKTGAIDFTEFIDGLSITVHGSPDDKIGFLFRMYDLNGNGFVSKTEMSTMLNCFSAPSRCRMSAAEIEESDAESGSDASHLELVHSEMQRHVQELIDNAFVGVERSPLKGNDGLMLSLESFRAFIERNPEVLDILDQTFSLRASENDILFGSDAGDVMSEGGLSATPSTSNLALPTSQSNGLFRTRSSRLAQETDPNITHKNHDDPRSNRWILFLKVPNTLTKSSSVPKKLNLSGDKHLFLDEIVTPDSVKQKLQRQRSMNLSKPIDLSCNSCGLHFKLGFCYTCGRATNTSDCSTCGKIFLGSIRFCPSCGNSVVPKASPSIQPMSSPPNESDSSYSTVMSSENPMPSPGGESSATDTSVMNGLLKPPFSVHDMHSLPPSRNISNESLYGASKSVSEPVSPTNRSSASLSRRPFSHVQDSVHHTPHHVFMKGYLFKMGRRFQHVATRYYILRDNFLYAFKKYDDIKAQHITWLEGCFVDAVNHENVHKNKKMKYGVELSFGPGQPGRVYYAANKKERDLWVECIRVASNRFDIKDFYKIGKQIGVGKFSSVCECTHIKSSKKYAVKIIDRKLLDDREREALRTEIAVLKLVSHPYIVQIRNVYETKSTIYIVMNLVKGGDLFDRIVKRTTFPENTTRQVIWKLLEVVRYLHDRGIVHRDLKPENIMIEDMDHDDHVIVGDFGLSKFNAPEEVMALPCGTLAYVAPEVLCGQGYGKEVDLWSVGIIMYVLLRGGLPFDHRDKRRIIELTMRGELNFNTHHWKHVGDDAKSLIRGLLDVKPESRLTVEQAERHSFFREIHLSEDDIPHFAD